MKLTNIGPAVVIAACLIATAAVPMGVSQAIGHPTERVPSGHTEEMTQSGDGVTFTAPEGFDQHLDTNPKAETYTSDGRTLRVVFNGGATAEAEVVRERAAEALTRDGYATSMTTDDVRTVNGLEGRSCSVVAVKSQQSGDCAILVKDGIVVSVVSVAEAGKQPLDLQPLLDSLSVVTTTADAEDDEGDDPA